MIKYIGSKRKLVPTIGEVVSELGASTAVDLFTGTTRVAQEFKRRGIYTTANDIATYSEVLGQCYISTDTDDIDRRQLKTRMRWLEQLPEKTGYVTRTFCEDARFFHPSNGRRIDAMRDGIENIAPPGDPLRPILLTSLMEAADRVDSTVGVQMAYLKEWAPRALKPIELRVPELLSGSGETYREDALTLAPKLPHVDVAYLDPPYNQHRYFTNYHIWETLIRWDSPDTYGVAQKRVDARTDEGRSDFNIKKKSLGALGAVLEVVSADVKIISFSNEGHIAFDDLYGLCSSVGHTRVLSFENTRYIGSKIGIHNHRGDIVGTEGARKNVEYLFLVGDRDRIDNVTVV